MQIGNTTFDVNAVVAGLVFGAILLVCATFGILGIGHQILILIRGYPPQEEISLSQSSIQELSDAIAEQVVENVVILMADPNETEGESEEEEQHPEPSPTGA